MKPGDVLHDPTTDLDYTVLRVETYRDGLGHRHEQIYVLWHVPRRPILPNRGGDAQ